MINAAGRAAVLLLCLASPAFAAMEEVKGVAVNAGCVEPAKAATGKLTTCPLAGGRMRIWCPNGRVFDRDSGEMRDTGIAVLRSICELNQLPG